MEIDKTTLKEPEIAVPQINNSVFDKIPKTGNVTETKVEEKKEEIKLEDDLLEDKKEEAKVEEKEEKKEEKKEEVEDSVVSFFQAKFGEVEGEFDDDLDGIAAYTTKVIEKARLEAKAEGLEELLDSTPLLKQFKEHLEAGYGVNSFLQQQQLVDWDSVKFTDEADNEKLQEQIFVLARETRGDSKEEIQEALELAKDKGLLKARAESSKDYLKKIQDKQVEDQKKTEKAQYDADKKEEAENLAIADKVLKSGNLYGVAINADKIKELRKFSFDTDKKGISERDKKIAGLTIEQSLLLDLILMNDFKDLGAKPKPPQSSASTFQKLKEDQAKKKRVDLNGDGLGSSDRQKINVKSLFNNN